MATPEQGTVEVIFPPQGGGTATAFTSEEAQKLESRYQSGQMAPAARSAWEAQRGQHGYTAATSSKSVTGQSSKAFRALEPLGAAAVAHRDTPLPASSDQR